MPATRRLCTITKNNTNPAYVGARLGAERVAAAHGCTAIHFFPQVPDDVAQQRAAIEAALASKPDAILMAPVHPTALNETIARIREAGLPLVYFVSNTEGLEPDCFITSDNHALALETGRYLVRHLLGEAGGGGNVAVIEGHPVSPTTAPRTRGFLQAAAEEAGITVVGQAPGMYQQDGGRVAMEQILAQGHTVHGVMAANDYSAMGALEALDTAGQQAHVVSVNAMPDAIRAIRTGRLLASAAYDAMQMGCIATEAAIRLLRGERPPPVITLPVDLITVANCAAWDRPYAERPLPEWERAVR